MPTASPPTFYTLPGGGRLRGDAAASLLRMRAAGMPAGGIDVYSRTMAQQAELRRRYEAGIGPLAAKPSPTAPHIKGVAIDLQTTRSGKYTPSDAHRWLTAGGDGSSPPKAGEKLRCHPYGWRRTVPSERWHFAYDPAKDTKAAADLKARIKALGHRDVRAFQRAAGLTVDGKAGPQTWTALLLAKPAPPAETPQPPTGVLDFVLLQANLQAERFGGLPDRSTVVGEWLKETGNASMMALCEVSETRRDAIRGVYGMSKLLTWPVGYVATMWNPAKWRHGGEEHLAFTLRTTGKPSPYHGAVRTPLTRDGHTIDLISIHVLSRASFPKGWTDAQVLAGKLDDVRTAMKMLYRKGRATIIAGDFNTAHAEQVLVGEFGLRRATPNVDTVDEPGDQKLDAVFISPGLSVRYATLLDPGRISDHKAWRVGLRAGGNTT